MKFEIHSILPYSLPQILDGLALIRSEQADPHVRYTPRKHTPSHSVFELEYSPPPFLAPFIGRRVALREDVVVDVPLQVVVTTGSEKSDEQVPPFMWTVTTFVPDSASSTVCSVETVWELGVSVPKIMEQRMMSFGKRIYETTLSRQSEYIEKAIQQNNGSTLL
jgi:hypothetical protein